MYSVADVHAECVHILYAHQRQIWFVEEMEYLETKNHNRASHIASAAVLAVRDTDLSEKRNHN
jgi:hypothetical protein